MENKLLDKESKLLDLVKNEAKPDSKAAAGRPSANLNIALGGLVSTTSDSPLIKADRPVLDIQPALQSNAWNKVLNSRVIWMAREGIQQASIRLNPASLGPVEVRLSMQNEQANVVFIAQHNATRDALEQALPRLRESFAENGLELANADVSEQSSDEMSDQQDELDTQLAQTGGNVNSVSEENNEQAVEVQQDTELGLSVYA